MATRPIKWISEDEASELTGYKKETLRKYVKSGKLDVIFSTLNNRKYRYNRLDIEKELLQHSNA